MHATISHHLQISTPQECGASTLYARALQRGRRAQLWAGLTGRSRGLAALGEVGATCSGQAGGDGDLCTVAIEKIRGSESRSADFDRDFNPLHDHTRDRWLSIARARERGKALPPVALIRIGDYYAVRDGHHRLSVARALGQKTIEAKVIVWQAEGPLPWDRPEEPAGLGIGRLREQLRDTGARLHESALQSVRALFGPVGPASGSPAIPN